MGRRKRKRPEPAPKAATPRRFLGLYAGGTVDGGSKQKRAPEWTALAASVSLRACIVVLSQRDDLFHGPKLFYHILTDVALGAMWRAALSGIARPPEIALAQKVLAYWRARCTGPTGQLQLVDACR